MATLSNTVITLYSVSNSAIYTANTMGNSNTTISSTSNSAIFTATSINNAVFDANLGKPSTRMVWG